MCTKHMNIDIIGKLQLVHKWMVILEERLENSRMQMVLAFDLVNKLEYPCVALERLRRAIQWQVQNSENLGQQIDMLQFFTHSKFRTFERIRIPTENWDRYCNAVFSEFEVASGYDREDLRKLLKRWGHICYCRLYRTNLWAFSEWDPIQYMHWCFNMYDDSIFCDLFEFTCAMNRGWMKQRTSLLWPMLEASSEPSDNPVPVYTRTASGADMVLCPLHDIKQRTWLSTRLMMEHDADWEADYKFPLAVITF